MAQSINKFLIADALCTCKYPKTPPNAFQSLRCSHDVLGVSLVCFCASAASRIGSHDVVSTVNPLVHLSPTHLAFTPKTPNSNAPVLTFETA